MLTFKIYIQTNVKVISNYLKDYTSKFIAIKLQSENQKVTTILKCKM